MRILGFLLAIGALVLLGVSLVARRGLQLLATQGHKTEAVVTALTKDPGSRGNTDSSFRYRATLEYFVEGERYMGSTRVPPSQFASLREGDRLPVTYLPSDPNSATLSTEADLKDNNVYLLGFGFMLLVGILVTYCSYNKEDDSPVPSEVTPVMDSGGADFLGLQEGWMWLNTARLWFLGILAGVLLLVGLILSFSSINLELRGVKGHAYVVQKSGGRDAGVIFYKYTVGRQTFSGHTPLSPTEYDKVDEGGLIDITYMPDEPDIASASFGQDFHLAAVFLVVGVGASLACAGLVAFRNRFPVW